MRQSLITNNQFNGSHFLLADHSGNTTLVLNQGYFYKLNLPFSMVATKISIYVATAGSGDSYIDLGLYDKAGSKLTSAGSGVISTSTTGTKTYSFTAINLSPGVYWLAAVVGGTTSPALYYSLSIAAINDSNIGGIAASQYPLPATVPALTAIGFTYITIALKE